MPDNNSSDSKDNALREQGALHPRPDRVGDLFFRQLDFFDARDLVQVKYEMLRRVHVEGEPVTRTAAGFGFSRPSFYEAQAAFEREGLPGLVPRKRGPRGPHKLTQEVMDFLASALQQEPSLRWAELAEKIQQRFGIEVHPRTIERRLRRPEKKRRSTPARSAPTPKED